MQLCTVATVAREAHMHIHGSAYAWCSGAPYPGRLAAPALVPGSITCAVLTLGCSRFVSHVGRNIHRGEHLTMTNTEIGGVLVVGRGVQRFGKWEHAHM